MNWICAVATNSDLFGTRKRNKERDREREGKREGRERELSVVCLSVGVGVVFCALWCGAVFVRGSVGTFKTFPVCVGKAPACQRAHGDIALCGYRFVRCSLSTHTHRTSTHTPPPPYNTRLATQSSTTHKRKRKHKHNTTHNTRNPNVEACWKMLKTFSITSEKHGNATSKMGEAKTCKRSGQARDDVVPTHLVVGSPRANF